MGTRRAFRGLAVAVACAVSAGWLTSTRELWPAFVAAALAGSAVLFIVRRDLDALPVAVIVVLGVLARTAVFPVEPTLSDDIYRFVWDAHVQDEGFNVYERLPVDSAFNDLKRADLRAELNSARYYSVYPPLSQFVFRAATAVTGFEGLAPFYGIKALLLLAELVGMILLVRLCRPGVLALYALNPLVVVEAAAQAHTESLVVPLIVAIVLLARRVPPDAPAAGARRTGTAVGGLLAGAAMVKLYPVLWLPFLARRVGARAYAGFVVVALVLALPFYGPSVASNYTQSLGLYVRLFEFNSGPYYFLKGAMRIATGEDWSKQLGPLLQLAYLLGVFSLAAVYLQRPAWARPAMSKLPLERIMFWVLAAFLVTATTMHPWYLVPLLALWAIDGSRSPAWLWLSAWSTGTYLFYSHDFYWPVVTICWSGWALILIAPAASKAMDGLMRRRARRKAARILPFLPHTPDATILDLGCGEGYVGAALADATRSEVVLADVVDFHKVELPFHVYDGRTLPLPDASVDAVVLYYVLHHTQEPTKVLHEARRVSRGPIVVVESTFRSAIGQKILVALDTAANRIRAGSRMDGQPLKLRSAGRWRKLFERSGLAITHEHEFGIPPHRQALFVLSGSGRVSCTSDSAS